MARLPLPRAAPASWLMVTRLELLTKAATTGEILRLVAPSDIEPDTARFR